MAEGVWEEDLGLNTKVLRQSAMVGAPRFGGGQEHGAK
jgi:hypothetical protein